MLERLILKADNEIMKTLEEGAPELDDCLDVAQRPGQLAAGADSESTPPCA
jgi:hypothetical protein